MKCTGDINLMTSFGIKFWYSSEIDWQTKLPFLRLTYTFSAFFKIYISSSIIEWWETRNLTLNRLFSSIFWNVFEKDERISLENFSFFVLPSLERALSFFDVFSSFLHFSFFSLLLYGLINFNFYGVIVVFSFLSGCSTSTIYYFYSVRWNLRLFLNLFILLKVSNT